MKRIFKMLVAALMAVIAPVCALAEEAAAEQGIVARFLETGKITMLGMVGIFAVMIVIYIVITVLNKTTK